MLGGLLLESQAERMTALLLLAFTFTPIRQLSALKLWYREGPKEQTFLVWLGLLHSCHIFVFMTQASAWCSFNGERWAEKEMASFLAWVLLKGEHDTRSWVKVVYLRGDPSN